MSRRYTAVPPPGYAQISNIESRTLSNDGFAMPLPVSQKKPVSTTVPSQITRKRKSRFSDAPATAAAPPPPTVLTDLPGTPAKIANLADTSSQDASSMQCDKSALISAAAAAAAKINANLRAQGKMKESAQTQLTSQSTVSSSGESHYNPVEGVEIRRADDTYSTEVVINDMPVGCRNYLTRLSTQESINKSCLAYVSTRGKYMTPEDKKLGITVSVSDKPLYLYIQSQNEANVKKALDRIRQIINNHFEKKSMYQSQALAQIASLSQRGQSTSPGLMPTPTTIAQAFEPGIPLIPVSAVSPMPPSQPALPGGNFVQEKLFIGLDALPSHFDLKNKLLGPNYRNFNFISNQTGARVILRGKGSGFVEPTSGREAFESMYAFICHPNQSGIDAAKRLVQNLVDTIKQDVPPNLLGMPTPVGSNGNHYRYPGDYRSVPTPVPPPAANCGQPPTPPSQMIAYPFQQIKPEHQKAAGSPSNQQYSYESSYSYQPNVSSEDVTKATSKSARPSKDKPRKRFTEDTDPTPPLPPEPANIEGDLTETESQPRMGSLPFWMAP